MTAAASLAGLGARATARPVRWAIRRAGAARVRTARARGARVRGAGGAATAAAVACLGLLLLLGLALAEAGAWFVAHRQARAAADLAALAGAAAVDQDPCGRAGEVASRNGASLTRCEVLGRTVTVGVAVSAPHRLGPVAELTGTARAGPA